MQIFCSVHQHGQGARSRAQHPSLCLCLISLCISLHMALRLLPISERSYVFALARPNRRIFLSISHTSVHTGKHTSLFLPFFSPFSLSLSSLTTELTRVLGTHGIMHVSASISVSLYLYHDDFFFLLFLPAPSIKRTRTHFSPPSPSRVRHPCSTKTTLIVRFAFLSLSPSSPSRSFSVQLAWIRCRIHTHGLSRTQSCASSPSLQPPFPTIVLISVLGHRACTHAAYLRRSPVYTRELSLSLSRSSGEHRYRVCCARERCGVREAGRVQWAKGRQNRAGKRRREREREREAARTRTRESRREMTRVEGGEERAPLAWRTMGFSCILLIFPKVRGGSLAVCSARA